MKSFWKWFAVIFIAGACLPAVAATVQGMHFPKQLGSFTLDSVINNEKEMPGQGVSLLYDSPGVKASVFVYDLRIKYSKRH